MPTLHAAIEHGLQIMHALFLHAEHAKYGTCKSSGVTLKSMTISRWVFCAAMRSSSFRQRRMPGPPGSRPVLSSCHGPHRQH